MTDDPGMTAKINHRDILKGSALTAALTAPGKPSIRLIEREVSSWAETFPTSSLC